MLRLHIASALVLLVTLLACDDKANKSLPPNDPDAASLSPTLALGPGQGSAMPASSAPLPPSAGASASAVDDAGIGCGAPPLPECPLFAWMKAHAKPAMNKEDALLLSEAFEKMATFAPPGYGNWASIAKDGERAAKSGSIDGARAACRECHEQYRKKYKSEVRARALP